MRQTLVKLWQKQTELAEGTSFCLFLQHLTPGPGRLQQSNQKVRVLNSQNIWNLYSISHAILQNVFYLASYNFFLSSALSSAQNNISSICFQHIMLKTLQWTVPLFLSLFFSPSRAAFLNLGTSDNLDQIILCCGECFGHYRMFSSTCAKQMPIITALYTPLQL